MNKSSRYISLILCLLVIFGLKQYFSGKQEPIDEKTEPVTVVVVKPKLSTIFDVVTTVGTLEPESEAQVVNGTPGLLEEKLAAPGEWVKKGQSIAKLKPEAVLRAPISGIILDWLVKDGNYLSVGTHVGDIINPEKLLVNYTLPETIFKKLKVGQIVELSTRADPQRTYKGQVSYVAPSADPKTHQVHVRALVENIDNELIPGLFVKITQQLGLKVGAILIPENVVTKNIGRNFVFKIIDNKIIKTTVALGAMQGDRVEVIQGVSVTDRVVLAIPPGIGQNKEIVKVQEFTGDW
ncbi:MAG: efflux RND transporter periplasmic adaptor subunit [Francisellaceae bacterium]|nr:efflux RND transporter periplasmic adaptor subunit [Francisellaceae bacterium]MBT6538256.1 efflux RND transporter periplasmic adaptor subunit [Francisellaceae bacterium]